MYAANPDTHVLTVTVKGHVREIYSTTHTRSAVDKTPLHNESRKIRHAFSTAFRLAVTYTELHMSSTV